MPAERSEVKETVLVKRSLFDDARASRFFEAKLHLEQSRVLRV
jgi:hypothetical protein